MTEKPSILAVSEDLSEYIELTLQKHKLFGVLILATRDAEIGVISFRTGDNAPLTREIVRIAMERIERVPDYRIEGEQIREYHPGDSAGKGGPRNGGEHG